MNELCTTLYTEYTQQIQISISIRVSINSIGLPALLTQRFIRRSLRHVAKSDGGLPVKFCRPYILKHEVSEIHPFHHLIYSKDTWKQFVAYVLFLFRVFCAILSFRKLELAIDASTSIAQNYATGHTRLVQYLSMAGTALNAKSMKCKLPQKSPQDTPPQARA